MTLLQIFFIVSGVVLLILGFDIYRKKKFTFLHIFLFFLMAIALIVFTFFPSFLDKLGKFVGVQRGADALVYVSIIFLIYFVLFLFNKIEKTNSDLTQLIRNMAIYNAPKKFINEEIVFVIPAYNESSVIKSTIQNLLDAGYRGIVVVNDGSTDNTLDILEKNFNDEIIILNHLKNRGQGAALETGFEFLRRYAGNKVKYIVTYDSDGQHDLKDLKKFLEEFKKDPSLDIVLGSRFLQESKTNIPLSRKLILLGGKIFTWMISGHWFSDVHNGYRVIKKEALDKIKITMDGMAHASEIQDIIVKKKLKFKEVPVNIKYTDYSLSKGQKSSNAINIAMKMIWSKFFK